MEGAVIVGRLNGWKGASPPSLCSRRRAGCPEHTGRRARRGKSALLPQCMDRLPFASEEVVVSEVADMYPAC
jgi:hypothetical protein